MKSHVPRWPTGSPDPAVNILTTGVLVIFGFLAFATSFFLLIPVAVGFGVIGLLRWYHYRPPPYSNPAIAAAAEQHAIAANFPDTEAFADSYARRLIDAWHPKLPVVPVFVGIVDVATDIYDMEGFNNPIAPIPADPIDQGRWRDELRIHTKNARCAGYPGRVQRRSDALAWGISRRAAEHAAGREGRTSASRQSPTGADRAGQRPDPRPRAADRGIALPVL
jgi:hypothetical protein